MHMLYFIFLANFCTHSIIIFVCVLICECVKSVTYILFIICGVVSLSLTVYAYINKPRKRGRTKQKHIQKIIC
jgi:hypothetical protein